MIDINHLDYKYPGGSKKVFTDFSLSLEDGKIYGLLGKNGTGKSTLLMLIAGLLRPRRNKTNDEGSQSGNLLSRYLVRDTKADYSTVKVDGYDSFRRDPRMLSDIFLVTEDDLLPDISLKAYVSLQKPFYPKFNNDVLVECLKDFGMDNAGIRLKALSTGQRKKVMISFAIATGCNLLLMDEPTNGLDIPSKALFRQIISKHMTDNRTLIISTHQVHDVEGLLDHIIIIDQKGVILNSPVADLQDKYVFRGIPESEMHDDNVIYTEPSVMGMAAMMRRQPNEPETEVNIELLFDAAMALPHLFQGQRRDGSQDHEPRM